MALLVVPPTVEPMTVEDVRLRLKYPRADQDDAIAEWIAAARNTVERYLERGLLTQTWELQTRRTASGSGASAAAVVAAAVESTESHRGLFTRNLTTFRAPGLGARADSGSPEAFGYVDLLWAAPLQAIVTVTDEVGIVPAEAYAVDNTVEPARLWWLDPAAPAGIATIRYRVGFGDTADTVPSNLRQVVFGLVQQYFLYRAGPPPAAALDETLAHADGYRVRTFA